MAGCATACASGTGVAARAPCAPLLCQAPEVRSHGGGARPGHAATAHSVLTPASRGSACDRAAARLPTGGQSGRPCARSGRGDTALRRAERRVRDEGAHGRRALRASPGPPRWARRGAHAGAVHMIALLGTKSLLHQVLTLHGVAAYAVVAVLCAGEAAVMLGFVVPGETAVVLGGVLAREHKVTLWSMGLVVVAAAVVGDSVGFEVGRRFGPWLLSRGPLRRRQAAIERGKRFIVRRGGLGVFLGRWTALLRALVPGLAGMSGMRYRRFLVANALGGIVWGLAFLLLGYGIGTSVERYAGTASYLVIGVLAAAVVARLRHLGRDRRPAGSPVAVPGARR